MPTTSPTPRSRTLDRRAFLAGTLGTVAGSAAAAHAMSRSSYEHLEDPSDPDGGAFGYDLPYPSRREPVLAQNVVATSQPLAAQAGLEMLRRGGNAIDAAVATAAALTVVEPTANGIGGDNFALIWSKGTLHGLNASGRAPLGLKRERYDGLEAIARYDWGAVTTPGAVSGWAAALDRFGSLPMQTVLAPAIGYARDGFLVSPGVGRGWAASARRYRGASRFEPWQQTFLVDGRPPQIGKLFRSPGHARTLERIAESNGRDFYEGELADRIARASIENGGDLRKVDLERHTADWIEPIRVDYRGLTLHEIPPNGQGLTALLALGILREFDIASMEPDAPECLHLQIEAMKLAFADAHRYIADPAHMDISPAQLLDPDYLKARAKLVDPNRATDFEHGTPKPGGTVLLITADRMGNMVSFIQSNYTGFGSGMIVPETGIALHNRGANFTLEQGHPNEIGPGKRPYHTIIPAFATRQIDRGMEPVMAFGVMGGFMQPQGHAQVMSRLADHEQNPQAILDAPRWQVTEGLGVSLEPGFNASVYDSLEAMGHNLTRSSRRSASYGRGQIIYRLEDGYLAASDLRADGQAVGF